MPRIFFILFTMVCLYGCGAVGHLEEITRLQSFSKQQESTDQYVEHYDEAFYRLILAIENKSIDQYPDKESILEHFVEPIQIKTFEKNGQSYEEWLYRRAVYFFHSAQVQLIFDEKGHLAGHFYQPAQE